jgi:hypothetical protein
MANDLFGNALNANFVIPQQTSQPQPQSKSKGNWITSLIPAATSILGGIGGTLFAPGLGTAAGGAAGGALGKKIQDLITGKHSSLGSYLGEAALGSLGGLGEGVDAVRGAGAAVKGGEGLSGALDALRFGSKGADAVANAGEGLSAAEKAVTANAANTAGDTGNIIGKTGSELRQSVINPKVVAGVGGAQKEAAIASEASQVPGLSAASKYKNLQGSMDALTNKITPILDKSTGTTETSKLLDTIRANAEQSPHFLAGDPTTEAQLNKVLTDLSAKTGGATDLTAKQLFDYKKGMDMNSVFTKLQKGADLNPKEASRLAVWQSLDSAITKAEPAVKDLTTQQSLLMQSAGGLKANASKTAGIPLFGIRSQKAEQVIQGAKELAGRSLEKVGGVATGEVPSTATGLVAQTAKNMAKAQIIPRVLTGGATGDIPIPQQDQTQPQTDQNGNPLTDASVTPDQSATVTNPPSPADESAQLQAGLRQAAIKALAAGDTKGLANIKSISDMLTAQDKSGSTALTKTQQDTVDNANAATSMLDTMLGQLGEIGGAQGRVSGLVNSVKGKLGLNSKVQAYNQTQTDAAIAFNRALTGSTRVPSPGALKLIEASLPSITDNPEEAQRKVDTIKQRLANKLSTIPGAGQ